MPFQRPTQGCSAPCGAVTDSRNVRVIGDPKLPVKRVGLGAHKLIEILPPLQTCDVVLMSEPQDCDAFPYVRDGISLGLPHPKGLIAITHERFEEGVGCERRMAEAAGTRGSDRVHFGWGPILDSARESRPALTVATRPLVVREVERLHALRPALVR